MLKLYYLLSYLLIPIIIVNLFFRILKKKEDKKRYTERFGLTRERLNSSKKTIWLHAASIGEFKSSDLIISEYHKEYNILVTTTTKSSADYVNQFYNKKVLHQYIPYDVPIWSAKFLNYWKPNLVLWIESDIWPNILTQLRIRKVRCFFINARVSPKSYKKWFYFNNLYASSLMTFNKIFAQSQNDLIRIQNLTNRNVDFIGNIKLSQKNSHNVNIKNNNKSISIMIASSHQREEEMILQSLNNIIKKNKVKLYIAPRHPNRSEEISKILNDNKLKFILESKTEDNNSNNITIIDSIGHLDKYFSKSEIVILGGSFVKKGGHNPIEPALYGCVVISGPYVYNWENIFNEMVQNEGCILLDNIMQLNKTIESLTMDKFLLEKYNKKALEFSNKKFFDNELLFKEINLVLK